MNYINIYRRFVITYMKGKLEYNLSLVFELIANTILIGVFFSGFFVIFYNFRQIAGWNKYETLFMMTTSWLSYSFSCFFFWSPMKDMGELVRTATDQNFVPVVDDRGMFIGIVTRQDILRYFAREYRALEQKKAEG